MEQRYDTQSHPIASRKQDGGCRVRKRAASGEKSLCLGSARKRRRNLTRHAEQTSCAHGLSPATHSATGQAACSTDFMNIPLVQENTALFLLVRCPLGASVIINSCLHTIFCRHTQEKRFIHIPVTHLQNTCRKVHGLIRASYRNCV